MTESRLDVFSFFHDWALYPFRSAKICKNRQVVTPIQMLNNINTPALILLQLNFMANILQKKKKTAPFRNDLLR